MEMEVDGWGAYVKSKIRCYRQRERNGCDDTEEEANECRKG